jgi:hypothetical protein
VDGRQNTRNREENKGKIRAAGTFDFKLSTSSQFVHPLRGGGGVASVTYNCGQRKETCQLKKLVLMFQNINSFSPTFIPSMLHFHFYIIREMAQLSH